MDFPDYQVPSTALSINNTVVRHARHGSERNSLRNCSSKEVSGAGAGVELGAEGEAETETETENRKHEQCTALQSLEFPNISIYPENDAHHPSTVLFLRAALCMQSGRVCVVRQHEFGPRPGCHARVRNTGVDAIIILFHRDLISIRRTRWWKHAPQRVRVFQF